MKSVYNFVVTPIGERYNNTKKLEEGEIILNTEIFNHQYVNRKAKVISIPKVSDTEIKPGDIVVVHHNVFRRWYNVKGSEKNSRSYLEENKYLVSEDQIFLYKTTEWKASPSYSIIKPIKSKDSFSITSEEPLVGIIKYSDGTFNKNELVGYLPKIQCEDFIDGERLYRVKNNFITIKYEYQGNEKEYNPSWTQSG